ncbi:uncharacterized protein BXZ73DRAFT_99892 [Epithele typhae]|uniref:uncharacterized protein n=1 Tax=Epithele typhae TaxID=378194 RepID=UPI002007DBAB|nr:uncharacterized protein BXZ73DRAFT_99892 [Epithele typhae]KAH9938831.1 hypothetical protein BXZ73DRAFT_99892 [Epithele typhae]
MVPPGDDVSFEELPSPLRPWRKTDSVIDLLIKYAVTTGLVLCFAVGTAIIIAFTLPDTMIWLVGDVVISKLNACVFLVTLNARRTLLAEFDHAADTALGGGPRFARSIVFQTVTSRPEAMAVERSMEGAHIELRSMRAGTAVVVGSTVHSSDVTFGGDGKV